MRRGRKGGCGLPSSNATAANTSALAAVGIAAAGVAATGVGGGSTPFAARAHASAFVRPVFRSTGTGIARGSTSSTAQREIRGAHRSLDAVGSNSKRARPPSVGPSPGSSRWGRQRGGSCTERSLLLASRARGPSSIPTSSSTSTEGGGARDGGVSPTATSARERVGDSGDGVDGGVIDGYDNGDATNIKEEKEEEKRRLNELDHRQRKFTVAMTQLGHTRRWKAVPVLIAEAGRIGLPLNVICLNAAMSVFAKSGRWYEALELLGMMRRGALLSEVSGSDQGRIMREPLVTGPSSIASSAILTLPAPDEITYNAAISACGRGKRWKPAVELLGTMRSQGLTPDGFSYSAAISACKNCDRWEMALELLDDMRRRGLERDRHSLNAAIAACASGGRWESAVEILQGMEKGGPKPDVFSYSSAIDAMAQGGRLDLALHTLRRMRASPTVCPAPNTVCYNVALKALTREGRWKEARALLTDVAAGASAEGEDERNSAGASVPAGSGVGPRDEPDVLDYLSYNSVIRACALAGEAKEALKTREEMRAAGIPADPYTYEALAAGCGLAGDWRSAEDMMREMLDVREHATATAASTGRRKAKASKTGKVGAVGRFGLEESDERSAKVGVVAGVGEATPPTAAGSQQQQAIEEDRQRPSQQSSLIATADSGSSDNSKRGSARDRDGEDKRLSDGSETAQAVNTERGEGGVQAVDSEGPTVSAAAAAAASTAAIPAAVTPSAINDGYAGSKESWNQRLRQRRWRRRQLENGVRPSARVLHGLMEAYTRAGEWQRALACLDDMATGMMMGDSGGGIDGENRGEDEGERTIGMRAGVPPDATSVGWAIQACAAAGQWRRALAVFDGSRSEGIQPGQLCFDAALVACADGGEGSRAVSLLTEMSSSVAAAAAEENAERLKEARKGSASSSPPGAGGGGTMRTPAGAGSRREPFGLLGSGVGIPPSDSPVPRLSLESYRLCMEACRKGGDTAGVLSVLAMMRAEGFKADLRCFNEALMACADGGGRCERASSFLEEMRWEGVTPDHASYSAVLRACESSSDQEEAGQIAYDLIQFMSSPHEGADTLHVGDSPEGYTVNGESSRSRTAHHRDDDSSERSASARRRRLDEWKKLSSGDSISTVISAVTLPSAADFRSAMRACAGSGKWSLALRLLAEVKLSSAIHALSSQANTKSDTDNFAGGDQVVVLLAGHYLAAISACGTAGNTRGVLALVEELQQGNDGGVYPGGKGDGHGDRGNDSGRLEELEVDEALGLRSGRGVRATELEVDEALGLRSPSSMLPSSSPSTLEHSETGVGGQTELSGVQEKERDELAFAVEATKAAMSAGILPPLSPSIYAAAANSLADAGEWEWCLVLLEELEQLDDDADAGYEREGFASEAGASRTGDRGDSTNPRTTVAREMPASLSVGGSVLEAERALVREDSQVRRSSSSGSSRGAGGSAIAKGNSAEDAGIDPEAVDGVVHVEVDETGLPVPDRAAVAAAATAAETISAYTATVRACANGGAGVREIVGVLQRMRWGGVEPDESTYAEAIRAFQGCGNRKGDEEGVVRDSDVSEDGGMKETRGKKHSVGEAVVALRAWEARGDGGDGKTASPFLYSAAMKVCAEQGEIGTGKVLFVEGRRAAGIGSDKAEDIAAAVMAAAASAARSGTAPIAPGRINRGVEAVYGGALKVCVAGGDGSLARDILRWMKMEGFNAGQEAFTLAIEACCAAPSPSMLSSRDQGMGQAPPRPDASLLPPPPAPKQGQTSTAGSSRSRSRGSGGITGGGGGGPESVPQPRLIQDGGTVSTGDHGEKGVGSEPLRNSVEPGDFFTIHTASTAAPAPATAAAALLGEGMESGRDDGVENFERQADPDRMPVELIDVGEVTIGGRSSSSGPSSTTIGSAWAAGVGASSPPSSPSSPFDDDSSGKAGKEEEEPPVKYRWVVVPGGREEPPEFEDEGKEIVSERVNIWSGDGVKDEQGAGRGVSGGVRTSRGMKNAVPLQTSIDTPVPTTATAADAQRKNAAEVTRTRENASVETGDWEKSSPPSRAVFNQRTGEAHLQAGSGLSRDASDEQGRLDRDQDADDPFANDGPANGARPNITSGEVQSSPRVSSSSSSSSNNNLASGESIGRGSSNGSLSSRLVADADPEPINGDSDGGDQSGVADGSVEDGIERPEAASVEWERAWAILQDMIIADHLGPPPIEVFHAVLSPCVAAGGIGRALEIVQAMIQAGHAPDGRLVSSLVESHSSEIEQELREMEEVDSDLP